jgi:hypothetical protein
LIVVSDDPVSFIKLHSPDHLAISVNAGEISTVRDPRQGHFGKGVHCVLVMTNRSFIGVVEDCDTVHRLLKGDKHP